ncbi:MAG: hypothetical protein GEEBNDBF_02679 [bacterium]|nr:hypothetical protein [bacterium]
MQLFHSDGSVNWDALISLICTTRGISHDELAHRVHCTMGDLEDWSRGITEPGTDEAERLWALSPRARVDPVQQHAVDPELLGESLLPDEDIEGDSGG